LLALGALLQLNEWKKNGLISQIDAELPSFGEAAGTMLLEAAKRIEPPSPLFRRVLSVWLNSFAWEAPHRLNSDVTLSEINDEEFTQLLAEFIWKNRHTLDRLLQD
jgi:hypothetical protein